jgi:hypothetical protein
MAKPGGVGCHNSKKIMKALFIVFTVVLLAGCAVPVVTHDDFTGKTIEGTRNNLLPQTFLGPLVRIDPYKITDKSGHVDFSFRVEFWSQNGWLFISDGESLIFLADGDHFGLTGSGSAASREVQPGAVDEVAYYAFTPELLKKLATAKKVRVRLVGSSHVWDGNLSAKNQKIFADFFAKYCN